jgi:hypothetical protein
MILRLILLEVLKAERCITVGIRFVIIHYDLHLLKEPLPGLSQLLLLEVE